MQLSAANITPTPQMQLVDHLSSSESIKFIVSKMSLFPMAKPFKSYSGGKEGSGVYQAIINEIPPHRTYAELFLGNGAIYLKKKFAICSILVDLSKDVYESWINFGVNAESPSHFGLWPGTTVYNLDAIQLLENQKERLDRSDLFIYLDPPYPFMSRKSQRPIYDHEMSDAQHIALLEVISCYEKAMVMISSYPNQLYDDRLKDWRQRTFTGQSRQGPTIERIWMNYPEPAELHDYRYIGENFRDRWNLTKSTRNIVNKFKKMPPLVRNAVLEAVISELKAEATLK